MTNFGSTSLSKKITLGFLLLIAILIIAYFIFPQVEVFLEKAWRIINSENRNKFKNFLIDLGWLGPIFIILSMVIQLFLLVIPSFLIMGVSILTYGPWWGSLIILIAIFFASTVGYWIGIYFGEKIVNRLLGEKNQEKTKRFVSKYGFWAVFITRLNPFLSNDAISLVAGLLKMGYWKYMLATFMGIIPLTAYLAFIGQSVEAFKTGLFWGTLICLMVFIAYIIWQRSKKSEH